MKTVVDANLFRLVYATVSRDDTRYYLNGVSIEPHPEQGAIMVSTDGHRMLIAHDEDGHCEEKIIVKLPNYALPLCKHKTMFGSSRRLEIDHEEKGQAKIVLVKPSREEGGAPEYEDLISCYNVLISGSFPDWRRVVPDLSQDTNSSIAAGFNTKYLKEFGQIGVDIAKTLGCTASFIMHKRSGLEPAIIRWLGASNIFAILMATRIDERDGVLPSFMAAAPVPKAV